MRTRISNFKAATLSLCAAATAPWLVAMARGGGAPPPLSSWTNVATDVSSGTGHERHRGSAWCDIDGDGLLDLYLAHFGQRVDGVLLGSPNQLLRNLGGGSFEDITTPSLAIGSDPSHHPAWADIDNDGLPDLYVGQSANGGVSGNHLIRQSEPGAFEDITNGYPLSMQVTTRNVSWQDVDNDGFVDLYVANSGGDDLRNWLMMNQGDGTFVREESILNMQGWKGRGIAWCDYNNDGRSDVYISNGAQDKAPPLARTNALFRNDGGGSWTNVANSVGVADIGHGRGVAWGDINNDGWMDLLVGNNIGWDAPGYNRLYRNNGDDTFTDITESAGIWENVRTRGVSMADFDNDGHLDLYIVSFGTAVLENRLFRNNGDETFTNVATGTPAEAPLNDISGSWADFNNDGWIDLYTVGGSELIPGSGENQLLRNDNQNGNHWLQVELRGVISNAMAIGARVRIVHQTAEGEMRQMRDVQSGSGYNSQHMMRTHFGLRDSTTVDLIQIQWPSGILQEITDVAADQLLIVTEEGTVPPVDCNGNGVEDDIDIATGVSEDCDGNGVPDECDWPDQPDCDEDGLLDGCEVDLDANGIPDDCECHADFDGNDAVWVQDLLILIGNWGVTTPGNEWIPGDLDFDRDVDVQDLLLFIDAWGPCP